MFTSMAAGALGGMETGVLSARRNTPLQQPSPCTINSCTFHFYVQRRVTSLKKIRTTLKTYSMPPGIQRNKMICINFLSSYEGLLSLHQKLTLWTEVKSPQNMTLLNVINMGRATSAALVVAVISVLVLQFTSTICYKLFIVLTIPFCLLCSKQNGIVSSLTGN